MSNEAETFGAAVFVVLEILFGAAVLIVLTGHVGDVWTWLVAFDAVAAALRTLETLAWLAVGGCVLLWVRRGGVDRTYFAPHGSDPAAIEHAIIHEARGHAAVGNGVRGTSSGIRAKVNADGSGWCEVPRRGVSLAGSLAITRAGGDVAGPAGCSSDNAKYKRDLRRAPRRYRDNIEAEAAALSARFRGSTFGAKVERALRRSGRFR
jgi:hypothetical protein